VVEGQQMKTIVKLKLWNCQVCKLDFEGLHAYINQADQVVCIDCLDFPLEVVA
jgi:hypothetical protein